MGVWFVGVWNPGPPSHPDEYRFIVGGPLMAKSYVPRMVFLAKLLNVYITKHQSTMFKYVTDSATQAAITNCNNCLGSLLALLPPVKEAP